MKIDKEMNEYIYGERFSQGFIFKYKNIGINADRIPAIIEYIKVHGWGNVVHLGACDHIDLIKNKIDKGIWMQGVLNEECDNVLGIDINKDAVLFCNNSLSVNNIICADIISDFKSVKEKMTNISSYWDCLYAGQVLEHIDDPVCFLKAIRERYNEVIKHIIISVPNAFKFENFLWAFGGKEGINTDHKYWFTPYTLAKVCNDAGYEIEEILLMSKSVNRHRFVRFVLDKLFPKNLFYRDVVVIAKFK